MPSVRYLGRFLDRPGGPRGGQNGAQRRPKSDLKIDAKNNRMLERSSDRLGAILVPSWGQEGQNRKKKWLWLENWACATTILEPQPPFYAKSAPNPHHSHFFRDRRTGHPWQTFTGP